MRVAIMLLAGAVIGPHGLMVLSGASLSLVDAVMPVAVMVLGILAVSERMRPLASRIRRSSTPLLGGLVALAAGLALYPALLATGIVPVAWRPLQAASTSLLVAVIAWLLLTPTETLTARRTYLIALLLLLGGVTASLSQPALLGALVAGAAWPSVGGAARENARTDLEYFRPSCVAILLVTAGAHTEPSLLTLGAGALLATALVLGGRRLLPSDMHPGLVAVVVAIDATQSIVPGAGMLVSIAALGAAGADIAEALLPQAPALPHEAA